MRIYIYSDESGVFDKQHNDIFVFGGLILLGDEEKEKCSRMYKHAEKVMRDNRSYIGELKASVMKNSDKNKLFRSLNNFYKFSVVVYQQKLMDQIFIHKKDKQRPFACFIFCHLPYFDLKIYRLN